MPLHSRSWTRLLQIQLFRTNVMSSHSESNIVMADALTLILHNQHALAAAVEEVTKWLSDNGIQSVADSALAAMETLDTNAQVITDAITRLRKL